MTTIKEGLFVDRTPIVRMENDFLRVDVAPSIGGRIVNLVEKASSHQFLWHNAKLSLEKLAPGSAYDPNFYGGIDELLPNDIPEPLNGADSPDHGELWTTSFDYHVDGDALVLSGVVPLCGLGYERRLTLRPDGPTIDADYRIENPTGERRVFLWKLHAALNIEPGDQIECPARTARAADLEWSRWHSLEPFAWPAIEGQRADRVPPNDGTVDFLFLYDLEAGEIGWKSASRGLEFSYHFDVDVFPYAWYFASYGGFDGHYTAILEPCTTMPLSVNEAAKLGQCSVLEARERIETRVTIYAGPAEP
jgi:hypothetical protein